MCACMYDVYLHIIRWEKLNSQFIITKYSRLSMQAGGGHYDFKQVECTRSHVTYDHCIHLHGVLIKKARYKQHQEDS